MIPTEPMSAASVDHIALIIFIAHMQLQPNRNLVLGGGKRFADRRPQLQVYWNSESRTSGNKRVFPLFVSVPLCFTFLYRNASIGKVGFFFDRSAN